MMVIIVLTHAYRIENVKTLVIYGKYRFQVVLKFLLSLTIHRSIYKLLLQLETLEALVIERIDHLTPTQHMIVKVAAVLAIGKTFSNKGTTTTTTTTTTNTPT